jgi:hypothetical protein
MAAKIKRAADSMGLVLQGVNAESQKLKADQSDAALLAMQAEEVNQN